MSPQRLLFPDDSQHYSTRITPHDSFNLSDTYKLPITGFSARIRSKTSKHHRNHLLSHFIITVHSYSPFWCNFMPFGAILQQDSDTPDSYTSRTVFAYSFLELNRDLVSFAKYKPTHFLSLSPSAIPSSIASGSFVRVLEPSKIVQDFFDRCHTLSSTRYHCHHCHLPVIYQDVINIWTGSLLYSGLFTQNFFENLCHKLQRWTQAETQSS